MVLDKTKKKIRHSTFSRLPSFLKTGDILIANNSKVIPARIHGTKQTGGKVEIFLLHETENNVWECLTKPGLKIGTTITIKSRHMNNHVPTFDAMIIAETNQTRTIKFNFDISQNLQDIGHTPLPPYIKNYQDDPNRYQTVFAKHKGSVAAPTAGLHFTDNLIHQLHQKGVELHFVTLHVGLGTFLPVKIDNITQHKMHAEFGMIENKVVKIIRQAKAENRRIITVGTTATRLLEFFSSSILQENKPDALQGWVDNFIYPSYKFQIIDGMITNFHLPKSTLLMLVSALAGREFILQAYEEAKKKNYRFYSFGDGMLIT